MQFTNSLPPLECQCVECYSYFDVKLNHNLLHREEYLCQSCGQTGERNSFFNKKHREESKQKQSRTMTGRYIGEKNPFYGKTHTQEVKEMLRRKMTGQFKGEDNPFYGKRHSKETIETIKRKNREYAQSLTTTEKKIISEKLSKSQKMLQDSDPEHYRVMKSKAGRASVKSQKRFKMNNLERRLRDLMEEANIVGFEYSVVLGFMQFDFGHKQKRILIEVQGDYWHGNPVIYGPGKKELNEIQKIKMRLDITKIKFADKNNFFLLALWESDINQHPKRVVAEIRKIYDLTK